MKLCLTTVVVYVLLKVLLNFEAVTFMNYAARLRVNHHHDHVNNVGFPGLRARDTDQYYELSTLSLIIFKHTSLHAAHMSHTHAVVKMPHFVDNKKVVSSFLYTLLVMIAHDVESNPVQRHITGVLENTRVFDEKYPGIFQYPGFIDKYPGIFHQIPGYLTACQIPG